MPDIQRDHVCILGDLFASEGDYQGNSHIAVQYIEPSLFKPRYHKVRTVHSKKTLIVHEYDLHPVYRQDGSAYLKLIL